MTKIKYINDWKKGKPIQGIDVGDEFDTGLDIANHLAIVHSKIKSTVSPDFVMAKFDDKNKEFVIEMIANAFFARNVLRSLVLYGQKKLQDYRNKRPYDKESIQNIIRELEAVEQTQELIFTTYTTKVQMVAVVNRNVPSNDLVKILAGFRQDNEDEIVHDGVSGLEKVKDYMNSILQKNEGG